MENQQPEIGKAPDFEQDLKQPVATVYLGQWNVYFLVKFILFWSGAIGFHALPNLAFAAFLLFPVKSDWWRKVKNAAGLLLGLSLFFYDSFLPPISRVLAQLPVMAHLDTGHVFELAGHFVNLPILVMIIFAWLIYRLVAAWIRVGLLVMSCMIVIAVVQLTSARSDVQSKPLPAQVAQKVAANAKPDLDKVVNTFYAKEATRAVSFPVISPEAVPFDVIFIHVCSLSWDDVRALELDQHPLWKRFDFLFTRFNSAASYGGPAAIRILRSTCGQTPDGRLSQPVSEQCYLMDSLKRSGFVPNLAMNHDGYSDDFLQTVQSQHLKVPPVALDGVAVTQHSFDGTHVYDDFAVLTHWLDGRQKSADSRVALYYNSISLHEGNRSVETGEKLGSLKTYRVGMNRLLDGIEKFIVKLERSDKRAVVVMIPEHGAAIRGDKVQASGLRDIPSPKLTLIPVGIKVIGEGGKRQGGSISIDAETSYLALTQIISRMIKLSPYTGAGYTPADYVHDLPTTPFVAQSDSATVIHYSGRDYWRLNDEDWTEYH